MASVYDSVRMPKPDSQIRLLKLDVHNSEQDFTYSLQTFDFDDSCPDYVAVSYTWGEVAPIVPLTVNRFTIYVRLNCWYALWQLRNAGYKDFLWIDSITIDQAVAVEKNHQVAMMGDIFCRAISVAACIGNSQILGKIVALDNASKESRDMIRIELSTFPYWRRAWIVQEVVLARTINMFCGSITMRWVDFENIWEHMRTFELSPFNVAHGGSEIQIGSEINDLLTHRRQYQSHTTSLDSFSLINKSWRLQCSDIRDRIYAFRSLLSPDDSLRCNIALDYAQSPVSLLVQVQLVLTDLAFRRHSWNVIATLIELFALAQITLEDEELHGWIRGHFEYQSRLLISLTPSQFRSVPLIFEAPSPILRGHTLLAMFNNGVDKTFVDSRAQFIAGLSQGFDLEEWANTLSGLSPGQSGQVKVLCWGPRMGFTSFSTYFLVHGDVQVNDVMVPVLWAPEYSRSLTFGSTYRAYAILRSIQGANCALGKDNGQPSYSLHSWALPLQGSPSFGFFERILDGDLGLAGCQRYSEKERGLLWHKADSQYQTWSDGFHATIALPQQQLTRFILLANNSAAALSEALENTKAALFDVAASVEIEHFIVRAYHTLLSPLIRAMGGFAETTTKRTAMKNFLKNKPGDVLRTFSRKELGSAPQTGPDLMNTLSDKCSSFHEALEEGNFDPDRHANLAAIFDLFIAVFREKP